MTVGVWVAIILFSHVTGGKTIPDLKGLVYSSKSFSLVWAICFLSMAGLPVTAGFLAKIYVFLAIAQCSNLYLIFLALIMAGSIIGFMRILDLSGKCLQKGKITFIKIQNLIR